MDRCRVRHRAVRAMLALAVAGVLIVPPPASADAFISGFAWYHDGTIEKSGPPGTLVTVYGIGLRPNTTFKLYVAPIVDADSTCGHGRVELNPSLRISSSSGFIGPTSGRVSQPPGTWHLCFAHVNPRDHPRGSPVVFHVQG